MTADARNVPDPRRVLAPVLLCYAAFVLIGIGAGSSGVLLLAQMRDYGVDRTAIGITFFTLSAGYVLGGLAAGALIQRYGLRTALAASAGAYVLTGLYLATRPPFAVFLLVQLIPGFGLGVLESALNAYLAALPGATTRLNRLHAFFGVGALIGPVLAAQIVAVAPWTVVWLVIALAGVPLVAGFLVGFRGPVGFGGPQPTEPTAAVPAAPAPAPPASATPEPATPEPATPEPATPVPATPEPATPVPAAGGLLRGALREPGVLFGAAMLAVYVGTELGVGNWGYSYLVQARALPGPLAGYAMSGFWLGLTLGRFLISPVAATLGVTTARMMYGCLAGVTAAAALTWLAPTGAVASMALVLLGFFLGPVFPTTMAIAPRVAPPGLVPTAIGVMNAASLVGGSVLPWLAGVITQRAGAWTLLPYTVTLAVAQIAVWRPLAGRMGISYRTVDRPPAAGPARRSTPGTRRTPVGRRRWPGRRSSRS